MFLIMTVLAATIFSGSRGHQGDDMSDDDFHAYILAHDDFRAYAQHYAEAAGRGCAKGATQAAVTNRGFKALCIGCAANAAGEVVAEIVLPRQRDETKSIIPEDRRPWEKKDNQWTLNLNQERR